ncbi:MAG: TonB-dependent receptor, partial [Paludibacter sp.]|nr:TonB-dependent receptor [Paludibacter sp.]
MKKKLFLYFMLCIATFSYSQSKDKTITISFTNISLSEAIQRIEKSCSYTFFYDALKIDLTQKVSLNAINAPIKQAITELLANTTINFEITNSQIALFLSKPIQSAKPEPPKIKRVSGVVLDEKGQPVIGASVIIPGTTIGVATDINGRFTLEAPSNAKLRISYIGYDAKEELLNASSDLKIKLEPTPLALKELVITAQAIGQKNAILQQINSNTIKNVVAADRLQENPDANAVEAIGRLPGVSVTRSGGEGTGLVIRGLESKYTAVTLNGVAMPSTGGANRETNISGISQYVLQGVEVYKSLTADMEANSVAGTVNLKLRQTIPGFHSNIMAQVGYNDLNKYFGNYKLQGEVSNRFFKDKLGVFFTASAESVNRSTQNMSASYGSGETSDVDILIYNANLNNIFTTKTRRSAMLSLDYKLSTSTVLNLYGLYAYANDDSQSQTKSYGFTGAGSVSYNFSSNPYQRNNMFQSALSGNTKLKFLKLEMEYGIAFSQNVNNNPQSRGWNFSYNPTPTPTIFSQDVRKGNPEDLIPMFTDGEASDQTLLLNSFGQSKSNMLEKNYNSYLNLKIPFEIGDVVKGNVKFGGSYRTKERFQDIQGGGQAIANNQFGKPILADSLRWIITGGANNDITAQGMVDYNLNNFLDGKYNYGSYYDFNKLNQVTDKWAELSDYYYNQGENVWRNVFGDNSKIGFTQDIAGSTLNDQDIVEDYGAGYLMTEINVGKWLMFLPGIRYEETKATLKGFKTTQPTLPGPVNEPIVGEEINATRSDKYLLPMIHIRVKPRDWFYTHLAYTQTLSRPDFSSISPNTWVNTGFSPFTFISNQPDLKAEQWTNYDVQFTFHGKKIGLFSVSGFYKTVQDKIWNRSYKRIKGDPIVEPFPDATLVNVSQPENHNYPIYLKGLEVELQTSFWYLPKPFNYLTFYANYTYTDSKTQYPLTRIENIIPAGGG